MGKAMLRQRLVGAIAVAITCLDAVLATASPSSVSALEQQALAEFTKAGAAVRERLAREAAGDLIGASIAARDADTHRYRFLDIQRELGGLRPPSTATLSVAASRNPFSPDPSFVAASTERSSPKPERKEPLMDGGSRPAWDMYRPRELPESAVVRHEAGQNVESQVPIAAGRAGDMYSHELTPAGADKGAAADDPQGSVASGEVPRAPFLVYRVRAAGGEARE
jgi:hypothetical protein